MYVQGSIARYPSCQSCRRSQGGTETRDLRGHRTHHPGAWREGVGWSLVDVLHCGGVNWDGFGVRMMGKHRVLLG